jgi:hypothetical protein
VARPRGLAGLLAAAAAVIFVAAAAGFVWVLLAGDDGWPERVPALSAGQFTEEPTDVWLTNGGTLFNQRYSPLDEIDRSNVKDLKGVWMTDLAEIEQLAQENADGAATSQVTKGRINSPFRQEVRVIVPGPQGGTNWQPSSYNPETGMLYICAMRSVSGYTRSGNVLPEGKRGQVADLGSVFTTTGFGTQTGYFGAWDPRTGRTAWQKRWRESCYSGTNSTVSVFEHEGTQYLAFSRGWECARREPTRRQPVALLARRDDGPCEARRSR